MQYTHCHNYPNTGLLFLMRKGSAQKTELIVTRYLPDVVFIEGSDKRNRLFLKKKEQPAQCGLYSE